MEEFTFLETKGAYILDIHKQQRKFIPLPRIAMHGTECET
jgi:hypothetical protein